jgi:hypothetical protein
VGTNLDAGTAPDPPQHAVGTARSVRSHWRRGHLRRIRYGEHLSESRLDRIRPVLVKAGEAFGAVKAKGYVVRWALLITPTTSCAGLQRSSLSN